LRFDNFLLNEEDDDDGDNDDLYLSNNCSDLHESIISDVIVGIIRVLLLFQVATTTWKRTLGKGLGAPDSLSETRIVRKFLPHISDYRPPQQQRMLRNYFKFMFVRHPFERLVSAWRSKLIDKDWPSKWYASAFSGTVFLPASQH